MSALLKAMVETVSEVRPDKFKQTHEDVALRKWASPLYEMRGETFIPEEETVVVQIYKWKWKTPAGKFTCTITMDDFAVINDNDMMTMYVAPTQVVWKHNGKKIPHQGVGEYPVSFSPKDGCSVRGLDRLIVASCSNTATAA